MCLAIFKPFLQFEDGLATLSCVACVLGLRLSLALRNLLLRWLDAEPGRVSVVITWSEGNPSAVGEDLVRAGMDRKIVD